MDGPAEKTLAQIETLKKELSKKTLQIHTFLKPEYPKSLIVSYKKLPPHCREYRRQIRQITKQILKVKRHYKEILLDKSKDQNNR